MALQLRDIGGGTYEPVVIVRPDGTIADPEGFPTISLGHGVKIVASAGTDVPLVASATPIKWVIVQAQSDNSGDIAVGAEGVDATVATGNGVLLDAAESVTLAVSDLAGVYIDATVNGDGVRFVYGA